MKRLPAFAAFGLSACLLWDSAWGQPSLTRAVPAAAVPGQTTEIILQGAKLDGATRVWTSFPAQVELVAGGDATKTTCKLTLPAGSSPGIGGIVISTPAGASDVLLLAIDDLPVVMDSGNNHLPESAQAISWPVAVDGVADAAKFDLYRIEGKAGQRVAVEVLAGRLDSSMDPVIRLLDVDGRELRVSDDQPGLGPDCRFEYTFAQDGPYLIQVHDNKYAGGGFYRMRVGDFPLVTTPYPLGVRRGSTVQLQFAAEDDGTPSATVLPSATLFLNVPDHVPVGQWDVAARLPDGKSSALAALVVSDLPEWLEQEPNDDAAAGAPVVIPAAVNGRLQAAGDRDVFSFVALKGQSLALRVYAGELGSPAVPRLVIQSADGKTLAETTFSEVGDQLLAYTIPADGTYQLVVDELLGRGGSAYAYRVELDYAPPFTLSLKNDKASVTSFLLAQGNGAAALDIDCQRSGYDGPIQLALEGPSGDLRLFDAVVAEKGKAAKLIVASAPHNQPGDQQVVRLVGLATINGRLVSSPVLTTAVLKTRRPRLAYPPAWMDGLFTFTTGKGPADPPFAVSLEQNDIFFARQLDDVVGVLKLERKDKEFKDPLQVLLGPLPDGFSSEVKREGEGEQEKYLVTVKGPRTAPLSMNPLRLTAFAAYKGQGYAVDQVATLHVLDPLTVGLTPAGPAEPGKTVACTVRVQRAGGDPQPVKLTWKTLPAGVTGPAEVLLAADQQETQVELTVAADAAEGSHLLVASAATQFRGRDIQLESSPIDIQIKKP